MGLQKLHLYKNNAVYEFSYPLGNSIFNTNTQKTSNSYIGHIVTILSHNTYQNFIHTSIITSLATKMTVNIRKILQDDIKILNSTHCKEKLQMLKAIVMQWK